MNKNVRSAVRDLIAGKKKRIEIPIKGPADYQKSAARRAYNHLILTLQKKMVPSRLKNALLRTTGMHIGKDACIPHDITFDKEFPELTFLEKGCIVGGLSTIICHEIRGNKITLGTCTLRERTLIGGWAIMKPGSVVHKHSILSSLSTLTGEIPEGQIWAGSPAKKIIVLSTEDIDKYFKPGHGSKVHYYLDTRRKTYSFIKDPKQMFLKIQYNGDRLNAGNDWWRARSVLRIWYNGLIVEACRMLPHCWLKTLLLRCVGVKIGKNCRIGYGVVFDHIFCDMITLEDNVRIDEYAYLDGHEYTIAQTIFGRITVRKGAHIKHHAAIRVGTTIGEGAVIEAHSFAQREIPGHEVWGGVPAKFIKKVSS